MKTPGPASSHLLGEVPLYQTFQRLGLQLKVWARRPEQARSGMETVSPQWVLERLASSLNRGRAWATVVAGVRAAVGASAVGRNCGCGLRPTRPAVSAGYARTGSVVFSATVACSRAPCERALVALSRKDD